MGSYNKNSSASALPRIKVKSPLSGLPPQCPGRIRCHLEVTVGPVEWNPLHSLNQSDDKMSLSLIWWGDESSTDLPISTTRETFTYFKPEWQNRYSKVSRVSNIYKIVVIKDFDFQPTRFYFYKKRTNIYYSIIPFLTLIRWPVLWKLFNVIWQIWDPWHSTYKINTAIRLVQHLSLE